MLSGQNVEEEAGVTREDVFQLIGQNLQYVVPTLEGQAFGWSDSMKELGANSMDRAEILMMTLEALNLNVPMVEFQGARNMGELAEQIHARLPLG